MKISILNGYLMKLFIIGLFTTALSGNVTAGTIYITSKDGIKIAVDTYIINDEGNTPMIVLFHQAGWSRGEYLEIAPKLNQLGFNAIAVDLRSGDKINNVPNLTAKHARQANKATRYIDSLPDMLATLQYINTTYPGNDVIAWGSSYSAALVLHIAGKHPTLVNGVLSFAPGEYFAKQGKSKSWIKESASSIEVPVFITSAKNEKNNWQPIYESIISNKKSSFLPTSNGNHGSRALWEQFDDSTDYWQAVTNFLEGNFK